MKNVRTTKPKKKASLYERLQAELESRPVPKLFTLAEAHDVIRKALSDLVNRNDGASS